MGNFLIVTDLLGYGSGGPNVFEGECDEFINVAMGELETIVVLYVTELLLNHGVDYLVGLVTDLD